MRRAGGSILVALVALACGVMLGVLVERWHTGRLVRSDVVCAASSQEIARLEEVLARQPRAASDREFMALIEQSQANIARNCGWFPPAATLPPAKPTALSAMH
jgi:hypothetical protein